MSGTITSEILADANISLSGTYIALLPPGLTHYTGTLSGSGTIALGDTGTVAATLKIGGEIIVLAPGESEALYVSGGKLAGLDVTGALEAEQAVYLSKVPLTVELPNGSFFGSGQIGYTGQLSGSGKIVVSGEYGNTLELPGGYTLQLGHGDTSPLQIVTISYANGVYTTDWDASVAANETITLNRYLSTVNLATGITIDDGGIGGTGILAIKSASGGGGLFEGGGLDLLISGENQTWDVSFGTAITVFLTTPLLKDWDIDLAYNGNATLAHGGITKYTGRLDGDGSITVSAAATAGGTLVIAGSVAGSATAPLMLDLPDAGQTEVITLKDANWSVDYSAAMAADQDIILYPDSTATLAAGITTLTKQFTGSGTLVISGGGTAAGTLVIGADRFVVAAGSSETLIVNNGAVISVDVTAQMEEEQAIYLSQVPLTVELPQGGFNGPGYIDYTGAIAGAGELIVTAQFAGEIFLPGGLQEELGYGDASPRQTVTITDNNGVYSTDWTQSVYAGEALDFDGDSTIRLSAGTVIDTNQIRGAGLVTLSTGADGGGTFVSAYGTLALDGANETKVFTFSNGAWTIATGSLDQSHSAAIAAPVTRHLDAVTPGPLAANAGQAATAGTVAASIDVTSEIAANQAISLSSDASAFLAAGSLNDTGGVTGNGELTLFGNVSGASTINLDGVTYTIAQDGVLGLNFVSGAATVDGETSTTAPIDITAAIDAGQQSIVFNGGKYIINIPAGQTISYSGVMSGTGTLEVAGGGTLVLDNNNTFTLPADQFTETIVQGTVIPTIYDGDNFGTYGSYVWNIENQNAPVAVVDADTTLDFGDPSGVKNDGIISDVDSVFGATYNLDNIEVNGTLNVFVNSNEYYGANVGALSGDGVVGGGGGNGTYFLYGTNTFSGKLVTYSINFGGSFGSFALPNAAFIDITQLVSMSVEAPTTQSANTTTISSPIYSQYYSATILNQGFGLLIFDDVWNWNDTGNAFDPSLSNPELDYMTVGGNSSQRTFDMGALQQFGNGTNAVWFLPGNASTTSLYFNGNQTLGLDYNGIVHIDTSFGPAYGAAYGATYGGNLIIVGTPGNHIIYTEQMSINGFTQIDANAILQLGDGTQGNSQTITAASAYGSITGLYSTSGGNGALLTAESTGGAATDHIIDNGQLIIDNVNGAVDGVGPISLSNISGSGSLFQEGTQRVTLLENTDYTGGTTIANGTLAIEESNAANNAAGISASGFVILLNAQATLDISQGYNQTIQNLSGVAGATVALGGNRLTLVITDTAEFDGRITDGGIGGGTGGSLVKQGSGSLTLGGDNTYTGGTSIAAGTLAGSVTSFGSGDIVNDGVLLIDQASAATFGNTLSGSGDLIKQGAGNVTLTSISDYAGAITIEAGSLTLSAVTATIAGPVTGAGTLFITGGASLTLQTAPTAILSFGSEPAGGANRLILPASGAPLAGIVNFAPGCVIEFAADTTDTTVTWVEKSSGIYSLYGVRANGQTDLLIDDVGFGTAANGAAYTPANFTAAMTTAGLLVLATGNAGGGDGGTGNAVTLQPGIANVTINAGIDTFGVAGTYGLEIAGSLTPVTVGAALFGAAGTNFTVVNNAFIESNSAGLFDAGVVLGGPDTFTNAAIIIGATGIESVGTAAGAYIENNGSLRAALGAGIYLHGAGGGLNAEQINAAGDGILLGAGGYGYNSGTISAANGIVLAAGSSNYVYNSGLIAATSDGILLQGAGSVTNTGTVLAKGTAMALDAGGIAYNYGQITAATGISIGGKPGGYAYNTGIIAASGDGIDLLAAGSVSNAGTIVAGETGILLGATGIAYNYGLITAATGINLAAGGNVLNTGTINGFDAGILVTGGGTVAESGTLTGGSFAVSFAAGFSNELIIDPGSKLTGTVFGGGGVLDLAADGTQSGTIALAKGQFESFDTIDIAVGAIWDFSGTFTAGSALAVVNDGTIAESKTDRLTIDGEIGGGGVIAIAKQELMLNGDVAAGQIIMFSGTGETLALGDASGFAGKIGGFATGDTINLTGIAPGMITGTHFSGSVLTLSESSGSIALTFASPTSFGSDIFVTTQGAAGTILTLAKPAKMAILSPVPVSPSAATSFNASAAAAGWPTMPGHQLSSQASQTSYQSVLAAPTISMGTFQPILLAAITL